MLAVRVRVLVVLVLAGLKTGVMETGRPDAARCTPLARFTAFTTSTVWVTLPPGAMATIPRVKERPKLGAAMVNEMVVVLLKDPELPLTISSYVPGLALLLAVRVSRLDVLVLGVASTAVTPAGIPDTKSSTWLLKPFDAAMPIVVLALPPMGRARELCEEVRVNCGFAIVTRKVVLLAALPEVPVIMRT